MKVFELVFKALLRPERTDVENKFRCSDRWYLIMKQTVHIIQRCCLCHTEVTAESSRDFGMQAVRGGLCAAVMLPFCSRVRTGIIPHSLLNQGLSLLFPAPPPRPGSFWPTPRFLLLVSKQPSPATMSCTTLLYVSEAGPPCPARMGGVEGGERSMASSQPVQTGATAVLCDEGSSLHFHFLLVLKLSPGP